MALEHPLGTTNPGEMFYPGPPQVTVADAAGASGSRAVEFGEDGTSASGNRGLFAVMKNLTYLYNAMAEKMAKPALDSWTPSGGNGGSYTFSGKDVWVGNSTYPDTQDTKNRLFVLLDEHGRELIDPITDNRVVVYKVEDPATPGTSLVGDPNPPGDVDGFFLGPKIFFKTQDPFSGALSAGAFTIDNSTVVRIRYAKAEAMENLCSYPGYGGGDTPEEFHDIAALLMGSSSKMEAGAFLRDGSRRMRGDLDLDVHGIKDATATSAIALTQSEYQGLYAPDALHASIVGDLSSKTRMAGGIHGNRILSTGGSFTFTGATGTVAWPDIHAIINGQHQFIAAGSLNSTDGISTILVVTSTGLVAERQLSGGGASAVLITDVPVAFYEWNSGGPSFDYARDIRWTTLRRSATMDVTVGDAPGCDFPGTDAGLQQALNMIDGWAAAKTLTGGTPTSVATIRVKGQIELTAAVELDFKSSTPTAVAILGEGSGASTITTSAAFSTSSHLIDCKTACVSFRGLTFKWGNTSTGQAAGKGAIADMGSYSRVEDVHFDKESAASVGFTDCMVWTSATTSPIVGLVVNDVRAEYVNGELVLGSELTYAAGDEYINSSRFENIVLDNISTSLPAYGIVVPGKNNIVRNFRVDDHGLSVAAVVVGPGCVVEDCDFKMGSGTPGTGSGVAVKPHMVALTKQISIRNITVELATNGVTGLNTLSNEVLVDVSNSRFISCSKGVSLVHVDSGDKSAARVLDCEFDACVDLVEFTKQYYGRVSGCHAEGTTGSGVTAVSTRCVIADCELDYGTGASDRAVELGSGTDDSVLRDNVIDHGNGAANGQILVSSDRVRISGNTVGGSLDTDEPMITITGNRARLRDNVFRNGTLQAVKVTDVNTIHFSGNTFDTFGAAAIHLTNVINPTVRGGSFNNCAAAVYGNETGAGGLGDLIVSGARFISCGGIAVTSFAGVIISDRSIAAGDNHVIVKGCVFVGCGSTGAGSKYLVYVNKRGSVEGCEFIGMVGATSGSDSGWIANVKGKATIKGNHIDIDPGSLAFPEIFRAFDAGAIGSVVDGNTFDMTPSVGPTRPTEVTGIYGPASGYMTADDNIFTSFDAVAGGAAYAIRARGNHNVLADNTVGNQSHAQATYHGIVSVGADDRLYGNRVPSLSAITRSSSLYSEVAKRTIAFTEAWTGGTTSGYIQRAGLTSVLNAEVESAGSVVGIVAAVGIMPTGGGSLALTVRINGADTWVTATLLAGVQNTRMLVLSGISGNVFSAGDIISVYGVESSFAPTANTLVVEVIVQFDEGEGLNTIS